METANFENNSDHQIVGVFLNSYTGTKTALCLDDLANCLIVYLPGNDSTNTMSLYRLKKPVSQNNGNNPNPDWQKLHQPSEIIMSR